MPSLIEPPDTHHLLAAIGWLELGNHVEANLELHRVAPLLRAHPDVMEVRWRVYARAKWWEACVDLANSIQKLAPERASGWLLKASSLRRTKGALTAWMSLLPACERFPNEPAITMQLACLTCQMGNLQSAVEWVSKSFERGDKEKLKSEALLEPDLAPIGEQIRNL